MRLSHSAPRCRTLMLGQAVRGGGAHAFIAKPWHPHECVRGRAQPDVDEALRLMRTSKASLFDDEARGGGGAEAADTRLLQKPYKPHNVRGCRSRMWTRRCGSCA